LRLILIGAPGSGKTTLAHILSKKLRAPHIEVDRIFWGEGDLRAELLRLIKQDDWILEGHLSKHHDITFPRANAFLVITGNPLVFLYRSLKRDLLSPSRFWFNLKNHRRMERKRQELIQKIIKRRPEEIFYLENLSYPTESELKSLTEALIASTSKSLDEPI